MPTSEEAKAWLAHAIANDELAHMGILGMKWGHRKVDPPASGIKSHAVDTMARVDAKTLAKTHHYMDANHALAQQKLINARIARRSDKNPDYAKAFAYHKPIAAHRANVKENVLVGALYAGTAAYFLNKHKDFLMRAAGSAALKVAARRGAKAAMPILKAIGAKPVIALVQGADGVFRLLA